MILAFVLNILVLQDRESSTLVALADRPIAAGSTLDREAIRLVPVDSDFEGLGGLITDDRLDAYTDWVLTRSLSAGEVVELSALTEPGSATGLRTMSLPVTVEHAAGGSLVPGDRIDVITVSDGSAVFVATDLEVVSVGEPAGGSLGATSEYHVVVAVTSDEALELAEALDAGSLEIVRSTGAMPTEGG